MIRAILIDDEPLARGLVKEYLGAHPQIEVVEECSDGFEGVKAIMQLKPQLIFLDIQMPKINGFEMLELIDQPPGVIFVTAFDEFALKAFEMHAIDYLLKPFSRERFDKAVEKFLGNAGTGVAHTEALLSSASQSAQQRGRIVVRNAGKIKIIPVGDIHYLEAADDYVKIHTSDSFYMKNRTMAHFTDLLDPQLFVRTHRSYILNVNQITRIDPNEKENFIAILKNGRKIPVSRSGYTRLKEVLGL